MAATAGVPLRFLLRRACTRDGTDDGAHPVLRQTTKLSRQTPGLPTAAFLDVFYTNLVASFMNRVRGSAAFRKTKHQNGFSFRTPLRSLRLPSISPFGIVEVVDKS
jgi:hypothetical protein